MFLRLNGTVTGGNQFSFFLPNRKIVKIPSTIQPSWDQCWGPESQDCCRRLPTLANSRETCGNCCYYLRSFGLAAVGHKLSFFNFLLRRKQIPFGSIHGITTKGEKRPQTGFGGLFSQSILTAAELSCCCHGPYIYRLLVFGCQKNKKGNFGIFWQSTNVSQTLISKSFIFITP